MKKEIKAEFDLDKFRQEIEASKQIKGDENYFSQLAKIEEVKAQIKRLQDELISIEVQAKGLIDAKAKALVGDNWQVIAGEGFKITRSPTGSVYDIVGSPSPKFVIVKKAVDTKVVDEYIAKRAKLPKGIAVNEERNYSIRINLK